MRFTSKKNILMAAFLAAALISGILSSNSQAAEGWLVDFEKAKAQAEKEGKSILMEFTGSDWCPPCKALAANVFSKDVWKTEAPKNFVLLKLDNPRDKSKQSKEEQDQYIRLSKEYPVPGVPTIYLTDAKGRPYHQLVGYAGDTVDAYLGKLTKQLPVLEKRDAAFAKAAKAKGGAKAAHLSDALSLMDDEVVLALYKKEVDQIIEIDDSEGQKHKAKFVKLKKDVEFKNSLQKVLQTSSSPDKALTGIESLVTEYKPEGAALQEALFYKGAILFQTQKKDEAKEALLASQKIMPESETGQRITQILKQFFSEKAEEKPAPKAPSE